MNRLKETLNKYVCDEDRVKNNIMSKISSGKKSLYFKLSTSFAVISVLIFGFFVLFNRPTAYVSIDVNPSFMLEANMLDRIIKVETLDEDSKEVMDQLNLYGENISSGIDKIVDNATNLGYVSLEEENAILVTTYCNNEKRREKIQQKIHSELNKNLNGKGIKSIIIDSQLPEDDAKKENRYGVSQAKIELVQRAIEENPALNFDDLINLSIKEIVKYIDEYKDFDCLNDNQPNEGNKNGNGWQNRKNI